MKKFLSVACGLLFFCSLVRGGDSLYIPGKAFVFSNQTLTITNVSTRPWIVDGIYISTHIPRTFTATVSRVNGTAAYGTNQIFSLCATNTVAWGESYFDGLRIDPGNLLIIDPDISNASTNRAEVFLSEGQ